MQATSPQQPFSLSPPKAVLFDWDNTLVQSYESAMIAFNNLMLKTGGNPITKEDLKNRPQVSIRQLFPQLFGEHWQKMMILYYEELDKVHLQHLRPFANAKKFLDILDENKVYMAIVSNKNGKFLRKEVTHLLWEPYFSEIIGCFDLNHDKPSPEPAYHVLEKGKIAPGPDVWFIGDSLVDYECARNAGLTPILIGTPQSDRLQPESLLMVEDFEKLIQLFQKLMLH